MTNPCNGLPLLELADENTIVVVTSDHGESFSHDYYFNHRAGLWDEVTHVPLLIGGGASGRSRAITCSAKNGVKGSTYVTFARFGSVMIVAGFEFNKMIL